MAAQNLQSVPAEPRGSAGAESASPEEQQAENAAQAQRDAEGQANFDRVIAEDSRIEPRDWPRVSAAE